jgi:hypothetical protein
MPLHDGSVANQVAFNSVGFPTVMGDEYIGYYPNTLEWIIEHYGVDAAKFTFAHEVGHSYFQKFDFHAGDDGPEQRADFFTGVEAARHNWNANAIRKLIWEQLGADDRDIYKTAQEKINAFSAGLHAGLKEMYGIDLGKM